MNEKKLEVFAAADYLFCVFTLLINNLISSSVNIFLFTVGTTNSFGHCFDLFQIRCWSSLFFYHVPVSLFFQICLVCWFQAFKVPALERGMQLCPGLSIVRTIKYTHNVGNAELASLPIMVNGKVVDYKLKV